MPTFIPCDPHPSHRASVSCILLGLVRGVVHMFSTFVATTDGELNGSYENTIQWQRSSRRHSVHTNKEADNDPLHQDKNIYQKYSNLLTKCKL